MTKEPDTKETPLPTIERLVQELEWLNYSRFDASRAAFMFLATAKGWQRATVARWLGISKVRITQKMGGFTNRVAMFDSDQKATFTALVTVCAAFPKGSGRFYNPIEYEAQHWRDNEFAQAVLKHIQDWDPKLPEPMPPKPPTLA